MDIEVEKIIVTLDNKEVADIAYHIKNSLSASIKNHYKNFDVSIFEQQCRESLNMMKRLYVVAHGWIDCYLEKELFDLLRKEQELKKLNDD